MTDFCHACGKPKQGFQLLKLAGMTTLVVLCCAGWAFSGLLAWEIERVRDRLDRLPQATFLSMPGPYPTVTVYREGVIIREPDKFAPDPLRKPENKKGVK